MTTPPGQPPDPQYPQYPQYQQYPQYPAQPGYPAYPPPGQYPYPPPPTGPNYWAIVSLIFGIIGGVLISVVCGIVGLRRAKEGRGGRGMAIAGLVLSALWVVGIVVAIALAAVFDKGTVSATDVKAGDCLKELPDSGLVVTVDTAPCSEPHKGEIFSVIAMPDGDFPGQAAIEEYQNRCAPELADYSPQAAVDPAIGLFVLYPSEDSWGRGDRTVTCIATSETPRTGTLKN